VRTFLAAVVLAWLALAAPAAAICEPSGAYDVATHEELPGAIVVWDSTGGLHESVDDGASWYPTNRLPLGSLRASAEVCADGTCYRVRADALGIERLDGDAWIDHWAYDSSDVEFLERQLGGACGEGYATLGLAAMIEAPADSAHAVLVAAGPDGLWAIDDDGDVTQDVFGTAADPEAPASAVYLTPERVGVAVAAVALSSLLLFWTGPAREQAIVAGLLGLAALPWVILPQSGNEAFYSAAAITVVIGAIAVLIGRRSGADIAEFMIGAFWAIGFAVAFGASFGAAEARIYSYVPALVGGGVMVLATWASRERGGGLGSFRSLLPVLVGALIGWGIYQLWAMRVIESKVVADALAAVVLPIVAWWGARTGRRAAT
jgi:hypothetical protein